MTGVPWELPRAPLQFPAAGRVSPIPLPHERESKRSERGSRKGKRPATGTGSTSALETINKCPQHQAQYSHDGRNMYD